jgi:hypothetical protein
MEYSTEYARVQLSEKLTIHSVKYWGIKVNSSENGVANGKMGNFVKVN